MVSVLYKCSGIKSIKALSDSNMETVYEMDDGQTYTVNTRIILNPETKDSYLIDAQVKYSIPIF